VARRSGFTLIEIMAVVAIIGMITALGLPRLSSARWRALGEAAESIAASLEFARQRAVLTGIPHRVRVDLEDGGWCVEWLVGERESMAAALADPEALEAEGLGGGPLANGSTSGTAFDANDPDAPIDLHPPVDDGRDYHPVPSRLGAFSWLDDDLYFVGLDGAEGWIEGGEVQIVFDADGSTEPVQLELADADDRHLTLEIESLRDRSRRREGAARS